MTQPFFPRPNRPVTRAPRAKLFAPFGAVVVLLASFAASPAAAEDAPQRARTSGTTALVAGGLVFGGTYIPSAVAGYASLVKQTVDCDDANRTASRATDGIGAVSASIDAIDVCSRSPAERFLMIPAVGPFLVAGQGDTLGAMRALYIADGALQIAGLATLGYGIVRHLSGHETKPSPITFAPSANGASVGLSALGTF